jgi:OOP family OmpA-OmpF porin
MFKSRLRNLDDSANAFGALLLIISIAGAFAPASALAQQQGAVGGGGAGIGLAPPTGGWYSGLSVGRSPIGVGNSGVPPVLDATTSNLSIGESGNSYTLFGGYRFSRNFALESWYTDFGNSRRDLAAPVFGTISSNLRSSGLHLDAVGIVPLRNGFSLYGKLGTIYAPNNSSISGGGAAGPMWTLTDLNPKRSDWNSKYGLGASYDLSKNLGLRFEYERINNIGDLRTGDGNVGMWSFGLTKRY